MLFSLLVILYLIFGTIFTLFTLKNSNTEGGFASAITLELLVLFGLPIIVFNLLFFFAALHIAEPESRKTHLGTLYVISILWLALSLYLLHLGSFLASIDAFILLLFAILLFASTALIHVSLRNPS